MARTTYITLKPRSIYASCPLSIKEAGISRAISSGEHVCMKKQRVAVSAVRRASSMIDVVKGNRVHVTSFSKWIRNNPCSQLFKSLQQQISYRLSQHIVYTCMHLSLCKH